MRSPTDKLFLFTSLALLFPAGAFPAEPPAGLHATVRYHLEDIYGRDHAAWPARYFEEDVNGDGHADWIATAECKPGKDCEADVFLCKRSAAGSCEDFCYAGSGPLSALRADPERLKCDDTC
jgi:hypothetical protein